MSTDETQNFLENLFSIIRMGAIGTRTCQCFCEDEMRLCKETRLGCCEQLLNRNTAIFIVGLLFLQKGRNLYCQCPKLYPCRRTVVSGYRGPGRKEEMESSRKPPPSPGGEPPEAQRNGATCPNKQSNLMAEPGFQLRSQPASPSPSAGGHSGVSLERRGS